MTEQAVDHSGADLKTLAAIINEAHTAAQQHLEHAFRSALEAGVALLEAKAQLNHGEWLPWLRYNFPFGARTAENYMLLARLLELMPDAVKSVDALSMSGALRALRTEAATRFRKQAIDIAELEVGYLGTLREAGSFLRELHTKLGTSFPEWCNRVGITESAAIQFIDATQRPFESRPDHRPLLFPPLMAEMGLTGASGPDAEA